MIYLLMLLGGLLPLAFLPDAEDADEPEDDLAETMPETGDTISLNHLVADVDTVPDDTHQIDDPLEAVLAPVDEPDPLVTDMPDVGDDVLGALDETDVGVVLEPVNEIDLPTTDTDFNTPLAPTVEVDLPNDLPDVGTGEVLAPVIEVDEPLDEVQEAATGDDTTAEFVINAVGDQTDVTPADVPGFEAAVDEIHLTLDPAYFGTDPTIVAGASADGLDGWIAVNDQIIATLPGAPDIALDDITIDLSGV